MPLFDLKTDPKKEQGGVPLNFGEYRITIKRAGGSNNEFSKEFRRQTKEFDRVLKRGKMPDNKSEEIMHSVYAKCVVCRWETLLSSLPEEVQTEELKAEASSNDGFVVGIDWKGVLIEDSVQNRINLFSEIPDVFDDIHEVSRESDLFREQVRQEDSKN